MGLALCCFSLSLYWTSKHKPLYHSTVQLYVDEPPVVSEVMQTGVGSPVNSVRRLYHEARSSSVMEHLVKTFDLANHYRIPERTPLRKERVLKRLQSRIDVRTLDINSLAITVKDVDRDMAARMANELHRELERMAERRTQGDIRRTKQLYASVIKEMDQRARKDERRVRALLDSVMAGPERGRDGSLMGLDLIAVAARLGSAEKDAALMRKSDQLNAVLAQKAPFTRIMLIRKATRDLDTDPVVQAVVMVLIGTLVPVLLVVMAMLFWYEKGAGYMNEMKAWMAMERIDDRQVHMDQGEVDEVPAMQEKNVQRTNFRPSAIPGLHDKGQRRPEQERHFAVVEKVVE